MSDRKLVYSTDPKDQQKLTATLKIYSEPFEFNRMMIIFKIEKTGRGGKTVTLMEGWPKNSKELEKWTKLFKSKCGSGGKFEIMEKFGTIEIQGDKRESLKKLLTEQGIKYKGM